jgi:creatinine amidohydrolase
MSVLTDTMVSDYVCSILAEKTDSITLPTMPFGQVWSAKEFPATVSLKSATLIGVIKDIAVSLEKQGARNVILFSGHLGNVQSCKDAARELRDEYGYLNVWHLGYGSVKKHGEGIMETELWNGKTFHAAEIETSIMLHISPSHVDMDQAVCDYPQVPPDIELRPLPWSEFSKTGVFGDVTKSTAEKGKKFLDNWLGELITQIQTNILY